MALEDAEVVDPHIAADASADAIERAFAADLDIVAHVAEAEGLQFVRSKERRVRQSCLSISPNGAQAVPRTPRRLISACYSEAGSDCRYGARRPQLAQRAQRS